MDTRERTFLDCYEAYSDALFRRAYYQTSSRELAADIVQEAFMRTWNALAEGKEIENMKAFVFRIAGNLVIDHYRRKKESSLEALAEDGYDPPDEGSPSAELDAEARLAIAHVESLDAPYREALLLRYVSGLSLSEIAATLGETENAIAVRIHRGTKQLREKMNP